MPHVTGNYSETEQIAHPFLPRLLSGNTVLHSCKSSHKNTVYFQSLNWLIIVSPASEMQPRHLAQLSKQPYCIFSKYLSLQHSICIQKPKQNTHIHKTPKRIFKQNDWATVERHPVNLLWSTLGLFICLSPHSLGCLVDNQLICNDNMPKRLKWGHSLRLCW